MTETVKAILVDARCRHDGAIGEIEAQIHETEGKLSTLQSELNDLRRRRAEIQGALNE